MELETRSLTLVPCSPEHLLALIDKPDQFEQAFGLPVADGLHEFYVSDDVSPDWLAALRSSSGVPDPWRHGFFVVHRENRSVIGSAGFKGQPDSTGTVEIAYGIVPSFQGGAMRPKRPLRWSTLLLPADRFRRFGRTRCQRRMRRHACFSSAASATLARSSTMTMDPYGAGNVGSRSSLFFFLATK